MLGWRPSYSTFWLILLGLLCFCAGTNGTYNRTEQSLQDKTQGRNSQGTSVPWQREVEISLWGRSLGPGGLLGGLLHLQFILLTLFFPGAVRHGSDASAPQPSADSQRLGHTSATPLPTPDSSLSRGPPPDPGSVCVFTIPCLRLNPGLWSQGADQVPSVFKGKHPVEAAAPALELSPRSGWGHFSLHPIVMWT